ncbi:MAG TPA: hypothetical protein P5180_10220 [Bacteroidales bacterium]|nr:hypothetical protein [Bacteroidales bacterium]HPI68564.1 hypothetical protein [Bacteroidales bacterium]HPR72511.1 hypothetical protein [Bacteroidales bacterium]HRW85796.1 hypothetical protein [Bacteroidales bacterium]
MQIPVRDILFWDIDLSRLNPETNRRIIIERVFSLGNLEELKFIFSRYGTTVIKKEIVNAGILDDKTLQFASEILQIPKEEFRCYRKKQSAQNYSA